ncbi:unnamed protein product [Paramecium pentaurelia]|uniref:Uncharacterized protein n=1 Tax=Paramecium pentaurelia TaxID=43138 RepID=A0A8S1VG78_9CILI|nr:unnamed protein product [Paramecium pentaurelia]
MNPKTNSQLSISIQKDPKQNIHNSHFYNFIKNKRFSDINTNKTTAIIKKTNHPQSLQHQILSINNGSLIKIEKHHEIQQPNKKIFFENCVLPKINTSYAINKEYQESKVYDENRQYSKRKSQLLKQLILLYQNDQSLSNITLAQKDCIMNPSQIQEQEQSRIMQERPQGKIQRRSQILIEQKYYGDSDLSEARFSNSNIQQKRILLGREGIQVQKLESKIILIEQNYKQILMNRLLITELGDTMRLDLKKEVNKIPSSTKNNIKTTFPEIKNNLGSSSLFTDIEKNENPLYQKSLSDQALLNLSKIANLSLFGPKCKEQLKVHIRQDLSMKTQHDYLNQQLERYVTRILDDKNLMTKRKRLEAKEKLKHFNHMPTDLSQFSSIIEDTDRENKLMSIVNAEGKLLQLQRRYDQKLQEDEKLKQQIQINYCKYKEGQTMQIEALPVLSKDEMEDHVKDIFNNRDQSTQRFHDRINEKHIKQKEYIWKQHHFPRNHRRWLSN